MVTILTLASNQVDYPSLCHLRQQTPDTIPRALLPHERDPWANRIRLIKLNQETIKAQPQPTDCSFSNGLDSTSIGGGPVATQINRDLSKIPMVGCDGSECRDNPYDVPRIAPKRYVLEFRRFREVDRNWPRPA